MRKWILMTLVVIAGCAAKNPVDEAVKKLKSPNAADRLDAARDLADMGGRAANAVPALAEALKDSDPAVARQAAKALGAIPEANSVSVLSAALKDAKSPIRPDVALALGKQGEDAKSTVPLLLEAMKDSDTHLRARAIEAIGAIKPDAKEAVPPLTAALADEKPLVRIAAAHALAVYGKEAASASAALQEAMKPDPRAEKQGAEEAVKIIEKDKDSKDAKSVEESAKEKMLEDQRLVRIDAAYAYWKVEGKAEPSLATITEILADTNPAIRRHALATLVKFGSAAKPALPEIDKLAKSDPDEFVKSAAVAAAASISK